MWRPKTATSMTQSPGRPNPLHARRAPQFQRLVALGLVDAFRLFDQPPKSWSWWDYRNLAFRKNQGLRIDHPRQRGAAWSRARLQHRQAAAQEREAQRPCARGR